MYNDQSKCSVTVVLSMSNFASLRPTHHENVCACPETRELNTLNKFCQK